MPTATSVAETEATTTIQEDTNDDIFDRLLLETRTEDNQPILNYNEDILEHDIESDPEPDCSKDDPPSLLQPLIVEPYSSEELKKLRENAWETILVHKMQRNAEEEKKIALEKGNIFQGKPYITVIGDGGWAKRSYGHGMSSKSGVDIIIGAETKKILFLGVKNKFCFTCSNSRKKRQDHICYKNYTGPSTGMESSVIVEGFKRSEEDYGLIYKYYIGDGDSSVFARIQEGCQYGRFVQKIECANHVTRALSDNLHKVAENTQYPLQSRQLLSKPAPNESITRLERIVKGVRTAIKTCGSSTSTTNVPKLRQAITNSLDHVFGNHERCEEFCVRKESGEENVIMQLDHDFLNKLRTVIGNVASKCQSLVFNETTNLAERYMGYVAKFTGGKRLNLTTGGSYQRRCMGAALAHSSGPSWHLSPWRKFSSRSPGSYFKRKILMREKRNYRRRLYLEKNPPKRKRRQGGGEYDSEYGPLAVNPDIEESEMVSKCSTFLDELRKDVHSGNNNIERSTIGQHTNPLWREKRINRLTASRFGSVAKRKPHTDCHNMVKSILIQRQLNTDAVAYGRDNEERVVQMYEERTGLKVDRCGLFIDETYPFLGASPDGLVESEGLIEVKCLYSIKDTSIEDHLKSNKTTCIELVSGKLRLKKSHDYYFQIQGQLNIAKRKWCDFVVFTRKGELFVERIVIDEEFWAKVLPKLVQFYQECILPEIIDSRLVRNLRIRNPPSIIEAQQRLKNRPKRGKKVVQDTDLEIGRPKRLKLLGSL
ncbi:uncharacterized protein LOC128983994 [Macrosteles quadrilineatus]|uniref:uncharacterized protein LOC128983994 n=1 Tax=Macrosteles quadrilineatus TaxID=74068 RepID=UPI0023E1C985|nr:uncharacterized protein LOC128983994 [Macrosteles quadrilineatus]